ncbi:hypothetical protein [Shinella zoogloeoides]|uniref:Uncharacterized protein n=1 Tax=Shinella zoogloeoides TaxID=352475 RepID=A0A6N8TE20_SHIZO|nr:hypothetical protein [Shinella zoogloeoides]MXO00881.1 hypothetical protein [Shinella zoogloeoides]UEX81205.1 hypothetical protein K8M09_16745 [Shinella zoogloeoides]
MVTFTVATSLQIEADTAEEAALLMYRELSRGPVPLAYRVTDGKDTATELSLDRDIAEEYAVTDHTADPGNW